MVSGILLFCLVSSYCSERQWVSFRSCAIASSPTWFSWMHQMALSITFRLLNTIQNTGTYSNPKCWPMFSAIIIHAHNCFHARGPSSILGNATLRVAYLHQQRGDTAFWIFLTNINKVWKWTTCHYMLYKSKFSLTLLDWVKAQLTVKTLRQILTARMEIQQNKTCQMWHAILKTQMSKKKVLTSHWIRKVNKTSQEDKRLHFSESFDFWVTFTSINN